MKTLIWNILFYLEVCADIKISIRFWINFSKYLFLIYFLQLHIICSYLQHSLESSKVFFFTSLNFVLGKVGLNILSNIGISCILEDRDKYFNVIITSFLLQMIAFTNWINHTCPLRQSSKKAQKSDLFYSWGPQKVSSFYGKPDLSEVIFLWDDSCIAIYQTLKYRHHYILVKAKIVSVFDSGWVCAQNFGLFCIFALA